MFDHDRVHETKERLWVRLHELLDEELQHLPAEEADSVREQLQETFRFWKRQTRQSPGG